MEAFMYNTKVRVLAGDISRQEVDAIVNSTATTLLSDGPVDIILRKGGGMGFLKECRHYVARHGAIPVGEAVLTGAGSLAARFVIHAVPPQWSGGRREERLLRWMYWNILRRADEAGASTVAIPAVGAGLRGVPVNITARTALSTLRDYLLNEKGFDEIRFVLLSKYNVDEYAKIWDTVSYSVGESSPFGGGA